MPYIQLCIYLVKCGVAVYFNVGVWRCLYTDKLISLHTSFLQQTYLSGDWGSKVLVMKKFKFIFFSQTINETLFRKIIEELKEFATIENGEVAYDEKDEKKIAEIFEKYTPLGQINQKTQKNSDN